MIPLFTISPDTQAFAFFFTSSFVVGALLLLYYGYRRDWPLLPWLTVMTCGTVFGLIGSKLMMIPYSQWIPNLGAGHLPATMDKTLLGGLLGGIAGILLAQRWLGFRYPAADAYALVLPVSTALGRIGCLLGGCCFGTPCRLPWAIAYGPGSEALQIHAGKGLISSAASASLPIHPLQVYDMLLMLGLAFVLWKTKDRLRLSGSLFLLYIALYGLVRFGEEFIREGGSSVWGLKHVQWGLLIAVAVAGTVLVLRERRPGVRATGRAVDGNRLRLGAAAAVLVAVTIAGRNWFTPLEMLILVLRVTPLALAVGLACLPARYLAYARQGALALSAGTVLLLSGDSTRADSSRRHPVFYNLDVGGSGGQYAEVCGPTHRFAVGGVGVSRTVEYSRYARIEYGVRAYGGYDGTSDGPLYPGGGVNPYFDADSRWIGGGIGIHAGGLATGLWFPQARLRLGPSDLVFLEARVADLAPAGLPQPQVQLALGREFKDGSSVRVGLGYTTGFFLEPSIMVGGIGSGHDRVSVGLTPYMAVLPDNPADFQFGLSARFRLGH